MFDLIFIAALIMGFYSIILFTNWCEKQVNK
jgi:hypothetical protein